MNKDKKLEIICCWVDTFNKLLLKKINDTTISEKTRMNLQEILQHTNNFNKFNADHTWEDWELDEAIEAILKAHEDINTFRSIKDLKKK